MPCYAMLRYATLRYARYAVLCALRYAMLCYGSKALSHAMARDGSSGGCLRLAIVDEAGVDRQFIAGDKLPYGPL